MSGPESPISRKSRGWDTDLVHTIRNLRPTTANSINNPSFDTATVQKDAEQTRIVVHSRYPDLVQSFLAHKRKHGSTVEKDFYNKDGWTWEQQVARLVAARPLVFMGGGDMTMMRDGRNIGYAASEWDRVGTNDEDTNRHLKLSEYLSYDEIMLGSLLAVSSPSYFINQGDRYNSGIPGKPGDFEPRGIIMGLVGSRFERQDHMDSPYIQPSIANPRQHPELNKIFREFFSVDGGGRSTQSPAKDRTRTPDFDIDMYKARTRITAEILLLEADARAHDVEKKAYVYVVGLGLGVWQIDRGQPTYYIEAFAEALDQLGSQLGCIGTLEFSWIKIPTATQQLMKDAAARHSIDVIFSKRSPAAKLDAEKSQQLLVLSYAWDGNAFPGNEYWLGSLSASGDPAAACMSQISELHNPVINPDFLQRVHVLRNDNHNETRRE